MLRLLDAIAPVAPRRSRRDAVVEAEHVMEEAERLVGAGLRCLELREEELDGLAKGDARKLALAALIRQRTAVPNAWIATRLRLGHVSRVGHGLRQTSGSPWRVKLETELDATAGFRS